MRSSRSNTTKVFKHFHLFLHIWDQYSWTKQKLSRHQLWRFPQGLRWKQLRPLRCWASNWGRLPSSCIPGLQQKHPKNSISSKTKLYFSLPCLQYFPISYRAVNGRCTGGGLLEIYLWIFGDTCDNVFIQF